MHTLIVLNTEYNLQVNELLVSSLAFLKNVIFIEKFLQCDILKTGKTIAKYSVAFYHMKKTKTKNNYALLIRQKPIMFTFFDFNFKTFIILMLHSITNYQI